MKLPLLTTGVLLSLFSTSRAQTALNIQEFGNGITSEELTNIRSITFDHSDMVVNFEDDGEMNFSISSIEKLYFDDLLIDAVSENVTDDTSFDVYPNPVGENEQVNIKVNGIEEVIVNIYSIEGILKQNVQVKNEGADIYSFSTTGLEKGMYLVSIQQGNNVETKKIIKK